MNKENIKIQPQPASSINEDFQNYLKCVRINTSNQPMNEQNTNHIFYEKLTSIQQQKLDLFMKHLLKDINDQIISYCTSSSNQNFLNEKITRDDCQFISKTIKKIYRAFKQSKYFQIKYYDSKIGQLRTTKIKIKKMYLSYLWPLLSSNLDFINGVLLFSYVRNHLDSLEHQNLQTINFLERRQNLVIDMLGPQIIEDKNFLNHLKQLIPKSKQLKPKLYSFQGIVSIVQAGQLCQSTIANRLQNWLIQQQLSNKPSQLLDESKENEKLCQKFQINSLQIQIQIPFNQVFQQRNTKQLFNVTEPDHFFSDIVELIPYEEYQNRSRNLSLFLPKIPQQELCNLQFNHQKMDIEQQKSVDQNYESKSTVTMKRKPYRCLSTGKQTNQEKTQATPKIKRPKNRQTEKKFKQAIFEQTQKKYQYFKQFRKVKKRNQIRRFIISKKENEKKIRKNRQNRQRRNAAEQFLKKNRTRFQNNFIYYREKRESSDSDDEFIQLMEIQQENFMQSKKGKNRKNVNNKKNSIKGFNTSLIQIQSQPEHEANKQAEQNVQQQQYYHDSQQIVTHHLRKRKNIIESQSQQNNDTKIGLRRNNKKVSEQQIESDQDVQFFSANKQKVGTLPLVHISNETLENLEILDIQFWKTSKQSLWQRIRSYFTPENLYRQFSRKHLISIYKSMSMQALRQEILNFYRVYQQNQKKSLYKQIGNQRWVQNAVIFSKLHSLMHVLAVNPNQVIKEGFLIPAIRNIVTKAIIQFLGAIANMLIDDGNNVKLQEALHTLKIISVINNCSIQPCAFNMRSYIQALYVVLENLIKGFNDSDHNNPADMCYIFVINPIKHFNQMFRISIKEQNLFILALITIVYAERIFLPSLFTQQDMKNLIKNKLSKSLWKTAKQVVSNFKNKISPNKIDDLLTKIIRIQEIYNEDYFLDSFDLWLDFSQIGFEQKLYTHSINIIEKYILMCLKDKKSKKLILNKIVKQSFLNKCEPINNPNQTYIAGYAQVFNKIVSIRFQDRLALVEESLIVKQLLSYTEFILNKKVDSDFQQNFQNLLVRSYNALIQVDMVASGYKVSDKFYQNYIQNKKTADSNSNIQRFRQIIERYLLADILQHIEYIFKQKSLMPNRDVIKHQTTKITNLAINFMTAIFGNCNPSADSNSYKNLQNFNYLLTLLFKLEANFLAIKSKISETFCRIFISYLDEISKLSVMLFREDENRLKKQIQDKQQRGQDCDSDNDQLLQIVVFERKKCETKITNYLLNKNITFISQHVRFKIKNQQQISRSQETYVNLMGTLDCIQVLFGKNLKQYSFKSLENILDNFSTVKIFKQAGSNYYSTCLFYQSYIIGIFKALSVYFPKQIVEFPEKIRNGIKKLVFLSLIVGGQEKAKAIQILKLLNSKQKYKTFFDTENLKCKEAEQISLCWILSRCKDNSQQKLLSNIKLIIQLLDCSILGQHLKQFQKLDRFDRVADLSREAIILYCYFSSLQKQLQEHNNNLILIKQIRGAIIRLRKMIQNNSLVQQISQKSMLTLTKQNNFNISQALIFCISQGNLENIIEYLSIKSEQLGLKISEENQNWVLNAFCKIIATQHIIANNLKKSNKIKKIFKIVEQLLNKNSIYSKIIRLIVKKICKNWFEVLDYFIKEKHIHRSNNYQNAYKIHIGVLFDLIKNTSHFQGYLLEQFQRRLNFIEEHYLPLFGNSLTIQKFLNDIVSSSKPDIISLYSLIRKRVDIYDLCNFGNKNCPQYDQLKKIIQRCIKNLQMIKHSNETVALRQKYQTLLNRLDKDPLIEQDVI